MITVYLGGPISGNPDYKQDFGKAQNYLESMGYATINPTNVVPANYSQREAMKLCCPSLLSADAVVLLDGWQTSPGTLIERELAFYTGIPVYDGTDALVRAFPAQTEQAAET